MIDVLTEPRVRIGLQLAELCRTPRRRPIGQWACEEVRLPGSGPHGGRMFSFDFLPWTRLWYAELEREWWRIHAFLGCVQGGKTLNGLVIPMLYTLFERGENCALGTPEMDMADDKWNADFLPVIEASRYRDLLPTAGRGSKGGKIEKIRFRNGVVLKFISAGGGDSERSGATFRTVGATEIDKYGRVKETSDEADPLTQMISRSDAHLGSERIFLECTVSTPEGPIWQHYTNGSQSSIMVQCPRCRAWVRPEREDFRGWQGCEDELTAMERAAFYCSMADCGTAWTPEERVAMNSGARLVHRGQTIDEGGVVHGDLPRTLTFGFRTSAFNNLLWNEREIARREWNNARSTNAQSAERQMNQFVWTRPMEPPKLEVIELDVNAVRRRVDKWGRGVIPPDTRFIGTGTDIGANVGHGIGVAKRYIALDDGTVVTRYHVFTADYFEMYPERGVERGIEIGLSEWHETIEAGWARDGGGTELSPVNLVDSKYKPDTVLKCLRSFGQSWYPSRGKGTTARDAYNRHYTAPEKATKEILFIGNHYHIKFEAARGAFFFVVDVDYWKGFIHEGLKEVFSDERQAVLRDGSISLWAAPPVEHARLVDHLLAEREIEEWDGRSGRMVRRWKQMKKGNHWFDCMVLAMVSIDYQEAQAAVKAVRRRGNWFDQRKN